MKEGWSGITVSVTKLTMIFVSVVVVAVVNAVSEVVAKLVNGEEVGDTVAEVSTNTLLAGIVLDLITIN